MLFPPSKHWFPNGPQLDHGVSPTPTGPFRRQRRPKRHGHVHPVRRFLRLRLLLWPFRHRRDVAVHAASVRQPGVRYGEVTKNGPLYDF